MQQIRIQKPKHRRPRTYEIDVEDLERAEQTARRVRLRRSLLEAVDALLDEIDVALRT